MHRRSYNNEEFDFEDDDYEEYRRGPRKFKKDDSVLDKKRKKERESYYDRDHDYEDRR